ncbi:hypothetical protein SynMINOS11_00922 [Synechococcus sp. Minos11]|nr:hypothetical protein SynMINOS11_00922 [Synechococcus sp. Minos11]
MHNGNVTIGLHFWKALRRNLLHQILNLRFTRATKLDPAY